MKKLNNFTMLLFISLVFTQCTLFSSAGLSSKGLPATQVNGNLTSSTLNSSVNLDHSAWTALLQKHVDAKGFVNYKGFKKDRAKLNDYLNYLSENKPTQSWSVQEQLAYYINVYNAFTIALILDNYPVKSIKDISQPWTRAFVPIGDVKMSLGGIENSILRKMNEPRIHFAINCASVSCPPLHNEAFTAAKINEQLDLVTRNFIHSNHNKVSENELHLSKIFEWYENDYKIEGITTLSEYVDRYTDIKIHPQAKVTFLEYDWDLNDSK